MNIFTSLNFGNWVDKQNINIPLNDRFPILSYKITRNDNSPRHMGIPHPLGYYRLCKQIRDNWQQIESTINSLVKYKEISMIRPKDDNKNKRLISMDSYDQCKDKEKLELEKQFGKKYYVNSDISSFFPSIYTHTISWALVGKKEAKGNQTNRNLWYNELDKSYRNIQDGETKGVPIGPDTSGIIAELILSQIDKKLKENLVFPLIFILLVQ